MRAFALPLLAASALAYTPGVSTGMLSGTSNAAVTSVGSNLETSATTVERTADGPTTLLWPPEPTRPRSPSEFELNQGRAIDTLRFDYPRLFTAKPDLSIFRDDIELHDLTGKRLQGKKQYEKVFDMLRFLRRTSMSNAEVTYHIFVNDRTIRMRWSAKLMLRDPAFGIQRLDIVDGVSVYELDSEGLIRSHKLENVVLRGHEQSQISLASLWPMPGVATPELAMPFFRVLRTSAHAFEEMRAAGAARTQPQLHRAQPQTRRAPVPQASAASGETPMQRAARERAEDAEKARRLAESNAPKKGGGLGGLFNFRAPQQCETSYDCDSPMVCCDLLFASYCCTGGMMIPATPEPLLQRQAIPIPVEKDTPPGMPAPPQYPGGSSMGF